LFPSHLDHFNLFQEIRINLQDPKSTAAVARLGSKGFHLNQHHPHPHSHPHTHPPMHNSSPLHHRSSPPPHFQQHQHHSHLHPYPGSQTQQSQPHRQGVPFRFGGNGAVELIAGGPGSFGAQEELWTLLRPQMNAANANANPTLVMASQPVAQAAAAIAAAEQAACRKNLQKMMGISPSDIDKYSRIFFPVTFTCFNLMYWIIYLHVSDEVAQDLVMLNQ